MLPLAVGLFITASMFAPAASQIADFWRSTLRQLSAEPMDAVVEPSKDPLPYRKFRVTLRGSAGV